MEVSSVPPAAQEHPSGLVIFTQKGIPVHTAQPGPVSKNVHVRNDWVTQSNHQITSASPEQTAALSCEAVVIVGSFSGMEIRFRLGQSSNTNAVVGVDVGVAVGVSVCVLDC